MHSCSKKHTVMFWVSIQYVSKNETVSVKRYLQTNVWKTENTTACFPNNNDNMIGFDNNNNDDDIYYDNNEFNFLKYSI